MELMNARKDEAMDATRDRRRNGEAGIALVLALMALMLLTFLGLTLATTTSTELQIATNYRWSQQAFYNAEAGVEAAKQVLSSANWTAVLPPARTNLWAGNVAPAAAAGTATARNYENWSCDARGDGMGYGRLLNDGAITYENQNSFLAQTINGSFTLWVRRPIVADPATGNYTDNGPSDQLILVSEGVAPYKAPTGTLAQANRAIRTIEVLLSTLPTSAPPCGSRRSGQTGGGPEGAGFGGCTPIDPSSLDGALGLGGTPGQDTTVR
jgi:hypothetical protein